MPVLKTIVCSTRPGRIGEPVGRWFHAQAEIHGRFEVDFVDLAAFDLPILDEPKHPRLQEYEHEHTRLWSATIGSGDAFAFVMPEYDYFVSAGLVNAIQCLSREWRYKPAMLVSYGGVSGGLRGAQAVKPLLTSVGIMPIPEGIGIPSAGKYLSDGVFVPADGLDKAVDTALDELLRWTDALSGLRKPV